LRIGWEGRGVVFYCQWWAFSAQAQLEIPASTKDSLAKVSDVVVNRRR